jgi:hypothetical protein
MSFQISGLARAAFKPLFILSDAELAERQVVRMTVSESPGFPCRVGLRDLEVGEMVLLLNHEHLAAPTPYRSRHAIFVGEQSMDAAPAAGEIPAVLARRTLSIRSFDPDGMMLDADLCEGVDAAALIGRLLADPAADCLHIHNARRGCFAASVRRA